MNTHSPARRLLFPLTPLYRLALAVRELKLRRGWERVLRLKFPVIGIGNLATGGAGKTPFAIMLARAFASRGCAVDILSRGYGRRSVAPALVRPDGTPEEFGDEPLLMAHQAGVPVYVGRQRYEAGCMAETKPGCPLLATPFAARVGDHDSEPADLPGARGQQQSPSLHILDDAFQHRQLHRDVDILLLNREDWNDRLLPAGNLREPLQAAKRADVIAIPCDDPGLEPELRAWGWNGPLWRLRRRMEVPRVEGPVLAFCGIARPDQFFAGLEAAGLRVAKRVAFRDHQRYTLSDVDKLQAAAKTAGASALVTTAKDEIRLRALRVANRLDVPILTAGLTVEIQDESAALDWLIARVRAVAPPILSL